MEKGLLIQPENSVRTVRLVTRVGTSLLTRVHEPSKQIRQGQADSMKSFFDEEMLKERPKAFKA